jgi:hypothetical protein
MLLRSIHSGSVRAAPLSLASLSARSAAHAQMTFLPARKCHFQQNQAANLQAHCFPLLWEGRLESLIECKISHLLRRSTSSSPSRPLLRADHLLTATTRALNTGGSLSPAPESSVHTLSLSDVGNRLGTGAPHAAAHTIAGESTAPRCCASLSMRSHRHYFISQPSIKTCCLWFCSAQCSAFSLIFLA